MGKLTKGAPSPRARLRASLKMAHAAILRHEAALADPLLDGHAKNLRHEYLMNAKRRVRKLTEALAAPPVAPQPAEQPTKQREATPVRRHLAIETEQPQPPPMPGMTLRNTKGPLRIAGHLYPRNSTVPIEAVRGSRNFQKLIDGGYLQWSLPPSEARP